MPTSLVLQTVIHLATLVDHPLQLIFLRLEGLIPLVLPRLQFPAELIAPGESLVKFTSLCLQRPTELVVLSESLF